MRAWRTNCGPMSPDAPDLTDDAILDGRMRLLQRKDGHRFGHDAILLAACVPAKPGDIAVEFGAGVGAAGLALLARVPGAQVTMAEIDPALSALACENILRNGLTEQAKAVTLDVNSPAGIFEAAGLSPGSADHVFMNPPFNTSAHQLSPDAARTSAHAAPEGLLERWIARAHWLLREGGTLTLIWRAEELAAVRAALDGKTGAVRILPVHGKAGGPVIRIVAQGVKGQRATESVLEPLMLNDSNSRPTALAEKVMRDCAALPLASPQLLAR